MANQKLTDKTVYASNLATNDKLMLVDTSDTSSSADGTSKQVDNKFIIQTDKVTLSNAQYLALNSTPKELVAQPGAGLFIVPITVVILYDEGATPNTNNGTSLRVGYKAIGSGNMYWDYVKSWSSSPNNNAVSWVLGGGSPTSLGVLAGTIANESFIMWLDSAPTGISTGTATIFVTYQIAKL